MNKIEEVLQNFPNHDRENLLPILQEIQKAEGYISEDAVVKVGSYLNIPTSKVYAVSTFYDQFRFTDKAKYQIHLCNGTTCHLEGAGNLLKAFEKQLNISSGQLTKDKLFGIATKPCMGACGMAPVVKVNEKFYTGFTLDRVQELIASIKESEGV